MTDDATSGLVVSLAKSFISLMNGLEPERRRAWFRFQATAGSAEAKASYQTDAHVALVDAVAHKAFFHPAIEQGRDLRAASGREQVVFLLTVSNDFNYQIDFEYEDLTRWRISKLGGATGIPAGVQ